MFDWITDVISKLRYIGVAALTFLENVFPPIPSELVIPVAGFVAAKGEMHLGLVIAAGTLGSLAGATLWYALGRRIGEKGLREWATRHGKWMTLSPSDVDRAQVWFQRHGRAAVFFGRLVPGVRTFISLPAGFSEMPLAPFLLYSALGTTLWTAGLAYAGVLLQANVAAVGDYLNVVTDVLLAALAVMIGRRYVRCWKESRS